jgi:hypothetical protein
MDARTKLATAFTGLVVLAALVWGVRDALVLDPHGGSGVHTFESRSQVVPSSPDDTWFSRDLPPVFYELVLRIDPALPSDAARDYRGANSDDSFDDIGDYGYTAEQMFQFEAQLGTEERLMLFARVGEWANPHAFYFDIPGDARDGDHVRAAGEAWVDLGSSKWRLEGLSGTLTLASTEFTPGRKLPFRFELRYFESGDPEKWTQLVASAVAVVKE